MHPLRRTYQSGHCNGGKVHYSIPQYLSPYRVCLQWGIVEHTMWIVLSCWVCAIHASRYSTECKLRWFDTSKKLRWRLRHKWNRLNQSLSANRLQIPNQAYFQKNNSGQQFSRRRRKGAPLPEVQDLSPVTQKLSASMLVYASGKGWKR